MRWQSMRRRGRISWRRRGRFSIGTRRTGYGENLFGRSEGNTAGDAARHWLKEKAAYNGEPMTAANFNSVGYYTQMVWAESTEVGFGMAVGPNGVIVVANYSPGGNRNGKKPF